MTTPEHQPLDPAAPVSFDLPAPVPLEPDADLSILDAAKILAAPDDIADAPRWRSALHRWRAEARTRVAHDDTAYRDDTGAWTAHMWNVALVWLWDEVAYDWDAGVFDADRLLAAYERFGGLDAVILWQAYPVIGIDRRNQFDWYRDVPGLREFISQLHDRGCRVFLVYKPWDTGTRRTGSSDAAQLVDLVALLGADGIFLDTMPEADPELSERLLTLTSRPALEGEVSVPLIRVADHHASWAQWFVDSDIPGVLRARWFEQRHMMHHVRRWCRDHGSELASAWVNGAGVLIWEVVFGVWVGWSDRDLATMRAMRRVQRVLGDHLVYGDWEPLTPLANDATAAGVHGSLWTHAGTQLWTVVNRGPGDYEGPLLSREAVAPGDRFVDVVTGAVVDEYTRVLIRAGAIGGVLRVPADEVTPEGVERVLTEATADLERSPEPSAETPDRRASHVPVRPAAGPVAPDAVIVPAGRRTLTSRFRRREPDVHLASDGYPSVTRRLRDQHEIVATTHSVVLDTVAVDAREVSNAEFATFLAATGYQPSEPQRFLAHWAASQPAPGTEDQPVTYVDLADARAYATWRQARLPTEDEWQVAAKMSGWRRGEPAVWNWTESEHRDGRTRWVTLKGGSWWNAQGSHWYLDGGPHEPEWSLRLLLTGGGLSRSECIGFRCVVDGVNAGPEVPH